MPNHWESSARPLFVKTVFVNGNRHAVLFDKDPLIRCGNSPFKKTSRPNSSLSFTSELSISSCDSDEGKVANLKQRQSTDLSTELQSCLVKLKLASVNKNKTRAEKCTCRSKEAERSPGRGKQKRQKWNREKRNQCECEESKACNLSGSKNSCYVYNVENHRGKKNYCFVKISSQPPKLDLNCCCNNDKTCGKSSKNMLISATIHNLVIAPDGPGNVFPFESAELYWNNYVTRSYYNSLSERVCRWLDLARKRKKQKEIPNPTDEDDSAKVTERIFSGKAFAEEMKKAENSYKSDFRIRINGEKITRNDSSEDVEDEVVGEPNIATLLSENLTGRNPSRNTYDKPVEDLQSENSSIDLSCREQFNNLRSAKSPLKVQDLLLNCHSEDQNKRRKKESRKFRDGEELAIGTLNTWSGGMSTKSAFVDKFDRQPRCHCNRNLDECADKIKNQILRESLPERNQKSINNLNNTRGRPVLIQNLLSPQQPEEMSYSEEEKIFWASEKSTGRPQLHIFIPSIVLKDQSEDSLSECENYLNLSRD